MLRLESHKRVEKPVKREETISKRPFVKIFPAENKAPVKKQKPVKVMDEFEVRKATEQNIIYHCMKYEENFDSMDDCLSYGNNLLVDCEIKAIEIENYDVVRCLKAALASGK